VVKGGKRRKTLTTSKVAYAYGIGVKTSPTKPSIDVFILVG
jgi:hypothetical protein